MEYSRKARERMSTCATRQTIPWSGRRIPGVTLVELLVVISIVAMLAAMLMPAVGMAREAARKAACLSNLSSLAKGFATYEVAQGQLPGWRNRLEGYSKAMIQADNKQKACVSWAVALLPYLGEKEIFKWYETYTGSAGVDDATVKRIGPYVCPSVAAEAQQKFPAALSYVANAGTAASTLKGSGANARQYRGDGVLLDAVGNLSSSDAYIKRAEGGTAQQYHPATCSLERVGSADGEATTALLAERSELLVPRSVTWSDNPLPAAANALAAEALHGFLQPTGVVPGTSYPPDPKSGRNGWMSKAESLVTLRDGKKSQERFLRYPSSAHGKGFPMAFCDGHVSVLSELVDPWVYAQLLSSDQANRSPEVQAVEKYQRNGELVHYILDAKDVEKR